MPMQVFSVSTNESRMSTLAYGTTAFPFAYYYDEIEKYASRCVEWHWHREFAFSLVVHGTVLCKIGNQTTQLLAGDGVFINLTRKAPALRCFPPECWGHLYFMLAGQSSRRGVSSSRRSSVIRSHRRSTVWPASWMFSIMPSAV